jgi:hypothetical protein
MGASWKQATASPPERSANVRFQRESPLWDASMHGWSFRRAVRGWAERFFLASGEKAKKEEFPGIMENMPPGNSFPQICVVSVNKSVGNRSSKRGQFCSLHRLRKEYGYK